MGYRDEGKALRWKFIANPRRRPAETALTYALYERKRAIESAYVSLQPSLLEF